MKGSEIIKKTKVGRLYTKRTRKTARSLVQPIDKENFPSAKAQGRSRNRNSKQYFEGCGGKMSPTSCERSMNEIYLSCNFYT